MKAIKSIIMEGRGIIKKFDEADTPVLNKVNIELYDGDFTVIMGASGAGKSTLLYSLSGMNSINAGTVVYEEDDITTFSEKQKAKLRAEAFGFVFQQTNLVSNLTLFENVAVAGFLNKNQTTTETNEKVLQLLQQMGIEQAMNRLPSQVSGGEAQRAAIARAIVNEPSLLFADEPTGALNRHSSDEVLSILQRLHEQGQNILMVTHDIRAAAHGTRLLYMEDGNILAELQIDTVSNVDRKEREVSVNEWLKSLSW